MEIPGDSSTSKACIALAEDLSLVPSTHIWWLTTIYNFSSRGSEPFLVSTSTYTHARGHTHTHMHSHMYIHTFKNKNKIFKKRKENLRVTN